MPALQRAIAEPRLTAPTAAFVESLAGTHEPDLSLEQLGHHVSLDGPAGLALGLARPVETYRPSTELVGRPRPRREAVAQRSLFDEGDPGIALMTGEEVDTDASTVETMATSFPVIDRPVPSQAPLTRLSEPQAAAVERLAMPRHAPEIVPNTRAREPAGGEVGTGVAARPITAQRLSLGQSRRLGLGAPLSKLAAATDQASLGGGTPPDLAPAPRAEGEEPVIMSPVERIAPIAGPTIQRRSTPETETILVEPHAELALARATATNEGAPAPPPEGAVIAQRAVATPMPSLLPRLAALPTAPVLPDRPPILTVRRSADSAPASEVTSEPLLAQRAPAADAGQFTAPASPLDMGSPLQPVPVGYREVVDAAPPSHFDAPPPIWPPPRAPVAQRTAAGAPDIAAYSPFVTQPSAPGLIAYPVLATTPETRSVQRATPVMDPPVQRWMGTIGTASPELSVQSAPAASGAAPTAASEPSGHSDKELDDLARKLHDRMSMHLRRDLLIQRERAGVGIELP